MFKKAIILLLLLSVILSTNGTSIDALANQSSSQLFTANTAKEVNLYIKKSGGDIQLKYRDLCSGEEFSIRSGYSTRAASTIKLPLVLYVMELAHAKKINLEEKLTYQRRHYYEGSGVIQKTKIGSKYTVRDLVKKAVVHSDNIAFIMLRERVGKQNFISYMKRIGGKYTYPKGLNLTSSNDLIVYSQRLYDFSQQSPLGAELIGYLKHTDYTTTIPRGIKGVQVAHKVGMIPMSKIYNDIGIVYDKNPFALVIMTNRLPYEKSQKVIADLSAIIYKHHKEKNNAPYILSKYDLDYFGINAGKTVKLGRLVKGEMFKISSVRGAMYEIELGNSKVLVSRKDVTAYPASSKTGLYFNGKATNKGVVKLLDTVTAFSDPSGKSKIAMLNKNQMVTIDSLSGNFYRINLGDRIAFIEKSKAELQFTATVKYFTPKGETVAIYDKPNGVQIGLLHKGETFMRIKDSGVYQEIQYGSKKAYVLSGTVLPLLDAKMDALPANLPIAGVVEIIEDADVYSSMLEKKATARLVKGQKIEYVQKIENWYVINLSGRRLFIEGNKVKE